MKKGFANTELIIVTLVLAVLLFFTVPKVMLLVHKAQEGYTKHELGRMRSAIAAYYGEHQGVYPTDDLSSLVPEYIEKIPQAKVPGFAPSNAVSTGSFAQVFTNAGGWAYVNDPKDKDHFGELFVNVDMKDSYGKKWLEH